MSHTDPSASFTSATGPLVAVTGASGFVAGQIINELVKRGYKVRGTVRSLSNKEKTEHLQKDFPSVQLYEADLLHNNSFKECFQDCEYIFHTASPFQMQVKDGYEDLVKPAVHGTENAVSTALSIPTVKRIIVTSSVAAMRQGQKPPGHILSEGDWNTHATVEKEAYAYSKTAAEKKAWELVDAHNKSQAGQSHNVSLVTINPSFVVGPPFGTRTDGTSVSTIVKLLDGTYQREGGAPAFQIATVDVRDIAKAHVEAIARKEASGRYLVSSRNMTTRLQMAQILKKYFPDYQIPDKQAPGELNPAWGCDPSKAEKELGIDLIPLETSLKDMAEKLIDLGMVKKE